MGVTNIHFQHASLQQYIKPLHTMIDQIDRLLKDYTGGQEKNLQQIKKKLEYMVTKINKKHSIHFSL